MDKKHCNPRKYLLTACIAASLAAQAVSANAQGGASVVSLEKSGSAVTGFKVNAQDAVTGARGIIAVYNEDKTLRAVKLSDTTDLVVGEQTLSFTESVDIPDGYEFKCFLWKTDDNNVPTKPICAAADNSIEDNTGNDNDNTGNNTGDNNDNTGDIGDNSGSDDNKDNTGDNSGSDDNSNTGDNSGSDDNSNTGDNSGSDDNSNAGDNSGSGDNSGGDTGDEQGDGIIHLNGTSINAAGIDNVTVDGSVLTITAAGDYTIEGTLSDGQIIVSATKSEKVNITLNEVDITSSTSAPIYGKNGQINLTLADGTQNTLTDASVYVFADGEDEPNACLFSKRNLTIKGDGSLTVKGNYKNGIGCKAELEIKTGNITVTAANHGIKGNDSVKIQGNSVVNITSGKDGIQSDNDEYKTSAEDLGTVTITGSKKGAPTVTINSGDDGIQAFGFVNIEDGTINITSTADAVKTNGVLSDVTLDEDATVTEVPSDTKLGIVNISGGSLTINSGEDGIQADCEVNITGGIVTIESCAEDAVNCAGNMNITDGTFTSISTYDGIQADDTLTISGGLLSVVTDGGYTNFKNTASGEGNTDSVDYSCKGLKAGNALNISGGEITVNARDDSLHSDGSVSITGGTVTAQSGDDGIHAETTLTIDDGDDTSPIITIKNSYEGLEGYKIYLNGGYVDLTASDDGINAAGDADAETQSVVLMAGGFGGNNQPGGNQPGGGFGNNQPGNQPGGFDQNTGTGYLYINGGTTIVKAGGDGLDSNGDIEVTGGLTIVNGPTSGGNGIFDKGDNNEASFTVTGGTIIGIGTSDMAVYPSSTTVPVLAISGQGSANNILNIKDSSDNDIITFTPSQSYQLAVVISPLLQTGTYKLYSGGTYTGGTYTGGLHSDGTYSGGTQKTTFTINSTTSTTSVLI